MGLLGVYIRVIMLVCVVCGWCFLLGLVCFPLFVVFCTSFCSGISVPPALYELL
jgi:hypothetical protein